MSRFIPLMVMAALIAGCDNSDNKTPTPTPPATKPAETKPATTDSTPKIELPKVDVPKVEVPKITPPKIETPKIETPKVETPKVEVPKTDAAKEQGSKLLEQLEAAVKSAKVSDAEAVITKIDAIKDKLPADMQTKFDTLKKAVADLKSKSNSIPKLPGTENK